MDKIPVIAVFDIGKTNKKIFLFNEHYRIVYSKSARFMETTDEDGDVCENIDSVRLSVFESLNEVLKDTRFDIKAINFTTYGASLVYVDESGKPVAPLYNYLKPFPEKLRNEFYDKYGGCEDLSLATASPCSDSLNAGLQFYRIKHQQPELYSKIKYALHLPQYVSSLITGKFYSDITSIGCHTHLWNFQKKDYHDWVYKEDLDKKLAPIFPSDKTIKSSFMGCDYLSGSGLHDSSAALIPYLVNFKEPFILISTGTWCISLNPFNHAPLTHDDLQRNCLCYLSYKGDPVKASRIFSGYKHEQEIKRIADHFHTMTSVLREMEFDEAIVHKLKNKGFTLKEKPNIYFKDIPLSTYDNIQEAYHALMMEIASEQYHSTKHILQQNTKKIFVDGGFSKNEIYMNLLAKAFPETEVYAASMAQATALGTALSIHQYWNKRPLPNDIIDLKYYSVLEQENI